MSTLAPLWNWELDSGGYTVHPVPAPLSTTLDRSSKKNAGTRSQKDRLFIRGNAMSTHPSIIGKSQFPNPPIAIGITMKKIIIKACAVTIELYSCSSPRNEPDVPNSVRITRDIPSPTKPA